MEPIAQNLLSDANWNRSAEHGPGIAEGVEFAALAAGIDRGGEFCKQVRIKLPADEPFGKLLGIDAGEDSSQPRGKHGLGQAWGVCGRTPDGEERDDSGA